MGIFSRNQSKRQEAREGTDTLDQIYVFVRCEDVAADDVRWSIAVSRSSTSAMHSANETVPRQEQKQVKRKKSLFDFAGRRSAPASPVLPSPSQETREKSVMIHEFGLEAGNLKITQVYPSPFPDRSESMLLQILLPSVQSARQSGSHPLNLQLEQALYRLTSSTSHLRNDESLHWLRLALVALQHEKFLPAPATAAVGGKTGGSVGLNVEHFMDFARNQWTGFEGEVLRMQNSTAEGGGGTALARYVHVVDYAGHVMESERVRGMVS